MGSEILVTGGSGSLGEALVSSANRARKFLLAPSHEEMDVSVSEHCDRFADEYHPYAIIHSAAMTDWAKCHNNPYEAFRVNTLGTLNIARATLRSNSILIYVSTDAVFADDKRSEPYKETDIPISPTSVYGVTKLVGEWIVKSIARKYLIVRIGWLFGPNPSKDRKFVGAILNQVANGSGVVKAVDDKHGSLSYAEHVADKIFFYIDNSSEGIRHLVNQGQATRYEIAQEVLRLWSPRTQVIAVQSDSFPSPIKRADFSVLESINPDSQLPAWTIALWDYHSKFPNIQDFRQDK